MTGKSETNCRRSWPAPGTTSTTASPRFDASREQREQVARRFFEAAAGGDQSDLLNCSRPTWSMVGDGGGKAWATAQPISGAERVARLLLGLYRRAPKMGVRLSLRRNGDASPGPLPTKDPAGPGC